MKICNVNLYPLLWLHCVLLCFSCHAWAASDDEEIHVFYPQVREPYNLIFDEIISGIEDGTGGDVVSHSISSTTELENYRTLIETRKPGTVIMLGNLGKAFLEITNEPATVLSGASLLTDADIATGLTGISISPDPAKLFEQLMVLEPDVQKISVVYHRETNGWLVEMARDEALRLGLEFESIEAADVREAATHYKEVLDHRGDVVHGLWLLQGDPTLDEKGLLPDVLAQAWNSNCVVFSSNPSHVNRGALFSLFPDNYEMGKSLVKLAEQILKGESVKPLPVNNLKKALNSRTAEHLNLRLSRSQQRDFDLVFPSR